MASAFYDQVHLVPVARVRKRVRRNSDIGVVEREFADEFRSANFLPGWFILPGAALFALAVFAAL